MKDRAESMREACAVEAESYSHRPGGYRDDDPLDGVCADVGDGIAAAIRALLLPAASAVEEAAEACRVYAEAVQTGVELSKATKVSVLRRVYEAGLVLLDAEAEANAQEGGSGGE